ncbi:MAG: phosphoribosylamine--glycine ligase, partial [Candidatus Aenigmatarchaeota archaeon]
MPEDLTVMVVDPGARGHVISERYEISPHVKRIIAASANDFVGFNRRKEVIVDGNGCHTNPDAILALAMKYKPDLIDVAQDDALALGAVDLLRENKFTVFGPTQAAAQIEWDKAWSRKFQKRYGIPHPDFRIYTDRVLAKKYIEQLFDDVPRRRVWVKAAGLAAGKGAISARTIAEAYSAIDAMDGFKEAGETFLLESDIDPNGEEYSIYALSDGVNYYIFKSAQDYKRAHDGDKGPNTGGMGAISPAMVTRGIEGDIEEQMIRRAIEGMSVEGRPFKGVLYLGGMKKSDGSSSVVEYNARFGDPETQVVLPGLKTDYVDAVSAVIEGRLDGLKIEEDGKTR